MNIGPTNDRSSRRRSPWRRPRKPVLILSLDPPKDSIVKACRWLDDNENLARVESDGGRGGGAGFQRGSAG